MKHTLPLLLILLVCQARAENRADEAPAIIAEASGKLISALTEAIAKDGAAGAISVCSEKAPEIAAAVGDKHGVVLRRVTDKPRNPKNAADAAQKELLAAFAGEIDKKQAPTPRTVTNSDGSVTFLAPIVIPTPLCLQCHGDAAENIAPETLTAIRKLYPDDKATGYKVGDLRGAWSVTSEPKP